MVLIVDGVSRPRICKIVGEMSKIEPIGSNKLRSLAGASANPIVLPAYSSPIIISGTGLAVFSVVAKSV